jgi:hypothetical protein
MIMQYDDIVAIDLDWEIFANLEVTPENMEELEVE